MARLGLQGQAEFEIALEFGGDLGVISDGSPVFRYEHGVRGVQAHHRADLAGVKSLTQRRYHAFGLSRECIGLGHQGFLFVLVPIAGTYSFHSGATALTAIRKSTQVAQAATALRSRGEPTYPVGVRDNAIDP